MTDNPTAPPIHGIGGFVTGLVVLFAGSIVTLMAQSEMGASSRIRVDPSERNPYLLDAMPGWPTDARRVGRFVPSLGRMNR